MKRGDSMGFLDKIKNALFEVEYVEVEEEKKTDTLPEDEGEKPIAKKVVLPEKKEEKIEQLQEEELKDEDFEIRPKDEEIKEKEEFKLMDEEDFRVEEDVELERPKFEETLERYPTYPENPSKETNTSWNTKQNKLYGIDNSYEIEMHPYGTESKEEKTFFRPSPIISPIYGILDKNYKKEDVKDRKEISSSYASAHTTVDEVRRKAYGEIKEEKKVEPPAKFDVEEEENLLVDLSDRSKPEVKELTMGDAIEYFQDLGLEYNVDYVDVSKEKQAPQKVSPEKSRVKEKEEERKKEKPLPIEELKEETKETVPNDNDNLFDLIDSMYEEKD